MLRCLFIVIYFRVTKMKAVRTYLTESNTDFYLGLYLYMYYFLLRELRGNFLDHAKYNLQSDINIQNCILICLKLKFKLKFNLKHIRIKLHILSVAFYFINLKNNIMVYILLTLNFFNL